MEQKSTQVYQVSPDDLVKAILTGVEEKMSALEQRLKKNSPPEYYNRKEVAKRFNVSTVTINNWCHKGVLKPKKIGGKILFLRNDIEETLKNSNNP